MRANCDTDSYLVVEKFWEILTVRNQAAQKFDAGRFNFRKLNELEVSKQYEIEITNRFETSMNLRGSEAINKAWENLKENIKTSAKGSIGLQELQQQKPWFHEECIGFLDQRKQAKMQWVQDPSQSNVKIQTM